MGNNVAGRVNVLKLFRAGCLQVWLGVFKWKFLECGVVMTTLQIIEIIADDVITDSIKTKGFQPVLREPQEGRWTTGLGWGVPYPPLY